MVHFYLILYSIPSPLIYFLDRTDRQTGEQNFSFPSFLFLAVGTGSFGTGRFGCGTVLWDRFDSDCLGRRSTFTAGDGRTLAWKGEGLYTTLAARTAHAFTRAAPLLLLLYSATTSLLKLPATTARLPPHAHLLQTLLLPPHTCTYFYFYMLFTYLCLHAPQHRTHLYI